MYFIPCRASALLQDSYNAFWAAPGVAEFGGAIMTVLEEGSLLTAEG